MRPRGDPDEHRKTRGLVVESAEVGRFRRALFLMSSDDQLAISNYMKRFSVALPCVHEAFEEPLVFGVVVSGIVAAYAMLATHRTSGSPPASM